MMCHEAREWVPQLLDGELEPGQRQQIERHLQGCANCAEAFDRAAVLREKIRGDAPYFNAPEELTGRVRKALRVSKTQRSPVSHWWRTAAGLAAMLAVTVILWTWRGHESSPELANEVVSAHVRAMQPGHSIDVPSSDRHTVKPWFNGKVDFSPGVEDLSGFELKGGRLDYLHGRTVAALVFQRRQHVIDLFIWQGDGASSSASIHGYNAIQWADAGMSYWAVSDLNAGELAGFRDAYRQKAGIN